MCRCTCIDLSREPVPDDSTTLYFPSGLCWKVMSWVSSCSGRSVNIFRSRDCGLPAVPLIAPALSIRRATPRTKNKARDSEMRQTRKGKQWYFGMKAHLGLDSKKQADLYGGDHGSQYI